MNFCRFALKLRHCEALKKPKQSISATIESNVNLGLYANLWFRF
ncbi:hypothetical protein [Helicobacter sp. 23-1045]